MITAESYKFKIATEPWEFEQINRLNYQTFVEEIPQHQPNIDQILVDKFNDENTYIICLNEEKILGMVTIRSNRPFSLDHKLDNLDSYLPEYRSICEVRLLAAKKSHRHRKVAHGLITEAVKYCLTNGHDIAVISAIVTQQKLYEHIGFVPFGPVVGNGQTHFQPMYLTTKAYYSRSKKPIPIKEIIPNSGKVISLMPGPVRITEEVKKAFRMNEISHRSKEYSDVHKETKELLCRLVNAAHVQIFMGSGTLANDVIAGQLSLLKQKGLILSNGEFGTRLITAAERFSLDFENISLEWGSPFDTKHISKVISANPNIKWLWAVHCETSTGMLNDIHILKEICKYNDIKLCMDCVSTTGMVPVDLSDVYLASAVSGKAFESFAGLAMVFYNHELNEQNAKLPCYLDLAAYAHADVVPYTICTGLVYALNTSLKSLDVEKKFQYVRSLSGWLKTELAEIDLYPLVSEKHCCPGVITLCLGPEHNSQQIGDRLKEYGYALSFGSCYLLARNWIQICLMTEIPRTVLEPFVGHLRRVLNR